MRTHVRAAAAVLLVAAATPALAVQFCVPRDRTTGEIREGGRIVLRAACKARELALPISLESGGAVVRLTGVNLQLVDGSGDTGGEPNGRGNLIIGYDEGRCLADPEEDAPCVSDAQCTGTWAPPCHFDQKTGSHNLIVGPGHRYVGTGAVAAGSMNTVRGDGGVAVGGALNVANGNSVAVGGFANVAEIGHGVSVGGYQNHAIGREVVVLGGISNLATGRAAAVLGGIENGALDLLSAVVGGGENRGEAPQCTILGGNSVTATAPNEVIVGP
jgi:hypothetical protein